MFKRNRIINLIMVAIALLAALAIVGFQVVSPPETLCDALILLGTQAVISIAIGAFVAALVEYWPAWEGFPPKWKRPIVFAFCLVVPLISVAGRYALCGLVVTNDNLYLALAAGALAFTGSQFAHIKKLPNK